MDDASGASVELDELHRLESLLDDRRHSAESENTVTLLVEGTGTRVLLAREAGLHKLRHQRTERDAATALVRVDVLPVLAERRGKLAQDTEVETRALRSVPGRLVTSLVTDVHLLHRPTMTSSRAWSQEPVDNAATHLVGVLGALIGAEPLVSVDVVRRYRFGRAPIVRDARTGLSGGRVDRVFGGELFLVTGT